MIRWAIVVRSKSARSQLRLPQKPEHQQMKSKKDLKLKAASVWAFDDHCARFVNLFTYKIYIYRKTAVP